MFGWVLPPMGTSQLALLKLPVGIGTSVDYGNLDFFFTHWGVSMLSNPLPSPKAIRKMSFPSRYKYTSVYSLFHAGVNSSEYTKPHGKGLSLTHPGPRCRGFTVRSFLRGPICWDGIGQLGKAAVELLVASRWKPPCTDAACPCPAACQGGCLQHPAPLPACLSPCPHCFPWPCRSHCPRHAPRARETDPWSVSLPNAAAYWSIWDSGKEKIPTWYSRWKNNIFSFLFLNLHVSILQWKGKLQVILFPWLPLQDLIFAVLGVRPTPSFSHLWGQSPGGTQANGTGGRSGAQMMWTQVLGTGSCSGLCCPAAAAAWSLLLTQTWMCHGMRARGWTRKGMCWLWEAKEDKCLEEEICT